MGLLADERMYSRTDRRNHDELSVHASLPLVAVNGHGRVVVIVAAAARHTDFGVGIGGQADVERERAAGG